MDPFLDVIGYFATYGSRPINSKPSSLGNRNHTQKDLN